jgi:hypothetical protein
MSATQELEQKLAKVEEDFLKFRTSTFYRLGRITAQTEDGSAIQKAVLDAMRELVEMVE